MGALVIFGDLFRLGRRPWSQEETGVGEFVPRVRRFGLSALLVLRDLVHRGRQPRSPGEKG